MTKDEALAMDLALEALEGLNHENSIFLGGYEKEITAIKKVRALDKKAENARALGLDYEPVGWWDAKIGFFEEKHFDQLQPLYTTPPAAQRTWVDLTDDEKQEWLDAMPWPPQQRHIKVLIDGIEAKLKEKNT